MRMSYTQMYNQFLRNIGSVGTTDANIKAEFQSELGQVYQTMLAKLANYKTYNTATFSTGMQAIKLTSGATTVTISSITSSGTTATVTTSSAHGYSTSDSIAISNCTPSGFNGTYTITVTSTTTFTYTLAASLNGASASNAQYFPYPPGYVTANGIVVTVGGVNFPLKIIDSEYLWEQLNAIIIQASALPQFYFPRRDDFGIWPVPQTVYTGTLYYHYRDRNLSVDDYTAGSVALTQNSTTLTGTSTTFTSAMVGRWFTVTDTTVPGQGYWFRVTGYTDSTHLTLSQPWNQATVSGVTSYLIGQTPEIPEEGHMTLVDGITAGYYARARKDADNATWFSNLYYTGDPGNPNREEGNTRISGGLIGLINRYTDRDDTRVINRKPKLNPLQYKVWATELS